MTRSVHTRAGSIMLEVLVAMTILGFAGVAVVSAAREVAGTAIHVSHAEQEMWHADTYLSAISLWPRDELDRHLGEHLRGGWFLRIERPDPELYDVQLADSATGHSVLHTVLYRRLPLTMNVQ